MFNDVKIRFVLSAVGVATGILGFIVLFIGYGNPDVGFWSVLITVLASICLHLHWVKGKDSLEVWHTTATLRNLTHVGFVTGVAGATAVIWYLFLEFYYKIPSPPIASNTLISATWAFICGKYGFTLMYWGDYYEVMIRNGPSSILGQSGA